MDPGSSERDLLIERSTGAFARYPAIMGSTWLEQWRALMTRIAQLCELAYRFVDATSVMGSDHHGMANKCSSRSFRRFTASSKASCPP